MPVTEDDHDRLIARVIALEHLAVRWLCGEALATPAPAAFVAETRALMVGQLEGVRTPTGAAGRIWENSIVDLDKLFERAAARLSDPEIEAAARRRAEGQAAAMVRQAALVLGEQCDGLVDLGLGAGMADIAIAELIEKTLRIFEANAIVHVDADTVDKLVADLRQRYQAKLAQGRARNGGGGRS